MSTDDEYTYSQLQMLVSHGVELDRDLMPEGRVKSKIGCGMGISVASPLIARDYIDRLVMRPFAPAIRFPTYLVYPRNSPVNMLAKAFASAMRVGVQELP